MLNIDYKVKALEAIHHGGDVDGGITRALRREKVLSKADKLVIPSRFKSVEHRREAIIQLYEIIFAEIFSQELASSRLIKIYDEWNSKVQVVATQAQTKIEFFELILNAFGIRSLSSKRVYELLELFSDVELLHTIKKENKYLTLLYRAKKEEKKKKKENNETISLFEFPEPDEFKLDFEISEPFYEIPYIHGNAVRGYLRRLLMRDYLEQLGISAVSLTLYHQLFTGGTLNEGNGGIEDVGRKREWIDKCPPIGLLGSAIGNTILSGYLKVGALRPACKEHNTGEHSFYSLLETKFNTRKDDTKSQTDIEINEDELVKASPTQMRYMYECFSVGSEFNSWFTLNNFNPLIESCFWRMIELWKNNPYIAGGSAKGLGKIDIEIDIPDGATIIYLEHIKNNTEGIKSWLNV